MAFIAKLILTVTLFSSPVLCGRMTCAQRPFDSGVTHNGHVYCGPGFHECVGATYACCSDVYATPAQLAISIVCPVAMILALALLGFVIHKAVVVIKEERNQFSKKKVAPLAN